MVLRNFRTVLFVPNVLEAQHRVQGSVTLQITIHTIQRMELHLAKPRICWESGSSAAVGTKLSEDFINVPNEQFYFGRNSKGKLTVPGVRLCVYCLRAPIQRMTARLNGKLPPGNVNNLASFFLWDLAGKSQPAPFSFHFIKTWGNPITNED